MFGRKPLTLPTADTALPGRSDPILGPTDHFLLHRPLQGPYPDGTEIAYFGMGCFWGAERKLWQAGDVWVTAVGYMGGITPNPTYEETCSGRTGHTEAVLVAFDPEHIAYAELLTTFWENHDPTQGMRQGNDVGTQYRSAVYTTSDAQADAVASFAAEYGKRLAAAGYGPITTEISPAGPFYFAEEYHQQYLAKNPGGYCGIGGTGVACQIGLDA